MCADPAHDRIHVIPASSKSYVHRELRHLESFVKEKIPEFSGPFAFPLTNHRQIEKHHDPHQAIAA